MGLRLVPRTLDGIQALGRLIQWHVYGKARANREAKERAEQRRLELAEQEEANNRKRATEIRHAEEQAYAREKGNRQAIIEMTEEARQLEHQHAQRMLAVRERTEEIAQQAVDRRKGELEGMVNAISAVTEKFRRTNDRRPAFEVSPGSGEAPHTGELGEGTPPDAGAGCTGA